MGIPKPSTQIDPTLMNGSLPWAFDGSLHRSLVVVKKQLPVTDAEDNEADDIQSYERQELSRMIWSDGVLFGNVWSDGVSRTSFRTSYAAGNLTVKAGRATVANKRLDLGLGASQDGDFVTAFVLPGVGDEKLVYLDVFERNINGPLYFTPAGANANRNVYADFSTYNAVTSTIKETTVLAGGSLPAPALGHTFLLIARIDSAGVNTLGDPAFATIKIVEHGKIRKFDYVVKNTGNIGVDCTHTSLSDAVTASTASAFRLAGGKETLLLVDTNTTYSLTALLTVPDRLSIEGSVDQNTDGGPLISGSIAGPLVIINLHCNVKNVRITNTNTAATSNALRVNGSDNCTIDNVGLSAGNGTATSRSLVLVGVANLIMTRLRILMGRVEAISGSDHNTISDSLIVMVTGGAAGSHAGTSGSIEFKACTFIANTQFSNIVATGCRFNADLYPSSSKIMACNVLGNLSEVPAGPALFVGGTYVAGNLVLSTTLANSLYVSCVVGGNLDASASTSHTLRSLNVVGTFTGSSVAGTLNMRACRITGATTIQGGTASISACSFSSISFTTTAGTYTLIDSQCSSSFSNAGALNNVFVISGLVCDSFSLTFASSISASIRAMNVIVTNAMTITNLGGNGTFMGIRVGGTFTYTRANSDNGAVVTISGLDAAGLTMTLTETAVIGYIAQFIFQNLSINGSITVTMTGVACEALFQSMKGILSTWTISSSAKCSVYDLNQVTGGGSQITINPPSAGVGVLMFKNCAWIDFNAADTTHIIVLASTAGANANEVRFDNCTIMRRNATAVNTLVNQTVTVGIPEFYFDNCKFRHDAGGAINNITSTVNLYIRGCTFHTVIGANPITGGGVIVTPGGPGPAGANNMQGNV